MHSTWNSVTRIKFHVWAQNKIPLRWPWNHVAFLGPENNRLPKNPHIRNVTSESKLCCWWYVSSGKTQRTLRFWLSSKTSQTRINFLCCSQSWTYMRLNLMKRTKYYQESVGPFRRFSIQTMWLQQIILARKNNVWCCHERDDRRLARRNKIQSPRFNWAD